MRRYVDRSWVSQPENWPDAVKLRTKLLNAQFHPTGSRKMFRSVCVCVFVCAQINELWGERSAAHALTRSQTTHNNWCFRMYSHIFYLRRFSFYPERKKRRKYQGQCYDKIRRTGKKKKKKKQSTRATPIHWSAQEPTETTHTVARVNQQLYIHVFNENETANWLLAEQQYQQQHEHGAATENVYCVFVECVCVCQCLFYVHKNTSQPSWISDMENADKNVYRFIFEAPAHLVLRMNHV